MEPFFEQQPLRFGCTRCGRCCVAGGGYYVFLNTAEVDRIRGYLGLSRDWFRRRYLRRLEEGDLVLAAEQDGRCVFLESGGRCRVYASRPLQCRTYPFWPEVMRNETAWQKEARRCAGINRGSRVAPEKIRKMLRACRGPAD